MTNLIAVLRQYEDIRKKERNWTLKMGKVVGMKAKEKSRHKRFMESATPKEKTEYLNELIRASREEG